MNPLDKVVGSTVGGKRAKWQNETDSTAPLITIITATYNASEALPITIKSIKDQSYPSIQWIIADGGSNDGTLELLRNNEDIIDYWFSGPDKGIYDAWNKALQYAKGDWIQFIGAGDELASKDVLSKVAEELSTAYPAYHIVYGNLQYVSLKKRVVLETVVRPWSEIKGVWESFRPKLPVHPEVFHHRTILSDAQPFPVKYKIAGDSYLLLKNVLVKDPKHIDILVDIMPVGGASWGLVNARMLRELLAINAELGIHPPLAHVLKESIRFLVKYMLVKILPGKLALRIADWIRIKRGLDPRWTIE